MAISLGIRQKDRQAARDCAFNFWHLLDIPQPIIGPIADGVPVELTLAIPNGIIPLGLLSTGIYIRYIYIYMYLFLKSVTHITGNLCILSSTQNHIV